MPFISESTKYDLLLGVCMRERESIGYALYK
jgi:hypothetical protein